MMRDFQRRQLLFARCVEQLKFPDAQPLHECSTTCTPLECHLHTLGESFRYSQKFRLLALYRTSKLYNHSFHMIDTFLWSSIRRACFVQFEIQIYYPGGSNVGLYMANSSYSTGYFSLKFGRNRNFSFDSNFFLVFLTSKIYGLVAFQRRCGRFLYFFVCSIFRLQ